MLENLVNLIVASVLALLPTSAPDSEPEPEPAPAPVISTIGGTEVPYGLDCVEDEVIYFTGPDTLDCVHIDNL